jgi:hypothetical protein
MTPRKSDLVKRDVRRLIARTLAEQRGENPADIALRRSGHDAPNFIEEEKSLVGGIADDHLVAHSTAILDLILEQSIVGRLAPRAVPVNSRVAAVDTGAIAAWVGTGRPKALSRLVNSVEQLSIKKLAALVVVSEELLASNTPAAESVIRDDLVRACSAAWIRNS